MTIIKVRQLKDEKRGNLKKIDDLIAENPYRFLCQIRTTSSILG